MPINLQNDEFIAKGWGRPPELQAPNIGGLVEAILRNRLGRDKMTQESIADAIKNFQGQRESAAYTDALQKAGLLPEGDYGGLGMKGGSSLAALLQRQQAQQAMEAHRQAMEARIGGRGRGGGDGGSEAGYPETTWDDQGREWRRGPGGRWIPVKPVAAATPQTDVAKTIKQQFGNRFSPEDFNPETVTIEPQAKDAPFDTPSTVTTGTGRKMSLGTFQAGVKAMHGGQQAGVGGYSDTEPPNAEPPADVPDQVTPGASPKPPPADSAAGHADNYGVRPSAATVARAQQALVDPEATEEEKAQARKILGQ